MVEQTAVTRQVVGSNPTLGAKQKGVDFWNRIVDTAVVPHQTFPRT